MNSRFAIAIAAALFVPLLAAGCGGSDDTNSGDRPSASEISGALSDVLPAGSDQELADCIGETLEESDLPNGVLRSLVAGEEETSIDKDNEEKYTQILTDAGTDCALASIGE